MNTKYIPFFIILAIFAVGGVAYYAAIKPALDNRTVSVVTPAVISRPDLALTFTFPSGEAGYAMMEQAGTAVSTTTAGNSSSSDSLASSTLRQMYVIMDTPAYTIYQAEGWQGEVPPTMTIMVFDISGDISDVSREEKLKNWARSNAALSAYNQVVGEPVTLDLDGVNALQYTIPGDYTTTFTLASYKDNVYFFAGQYELETDDIKNTYHALVDSVEFD